ncbi:hypothetical protein IX307_001353 [Bacteroides pyogenes]|nr:hypothetical protein [Bacteroides pyogenes]MBR8725824.1 hypothetical protein [Bacteroides pyogenes]MBR8739468.1 hypothetical protein [Bacteroides pyogenes]MBR8754983.1 hypothetical protein [Bacteroides pyogenes]MBR8787032.1 hypothetical protein [Bacteroides pyogenes]
MSETANIMGLFNNLFDSKKKEAIARVEFPSHKRILEDSVKMIQTTRKLETLLTRYNLAMEHYNWIQRQIADGAPIYFKSHGHFPEELREHANYHIERLAREAYTAYREKSASLKTEKAKETQKIKTKALLERYKGALMSSSKMFEWKHKIEELEKKITTL